MERMPTPYFLPTTASGRRPMDNRQSWQIAADKNGSASNLRIPLLAMFQELCKNRLLNADRASTFIQRLEPLESIPAVKSAPCRFRACQHLRRIDQG
ncbi:hypothetical protein, partial [Bifidobacterium sp. ESL0825]|uniref:hypothetical protein n=1 Tax=Bifidobacterium sp. ESL0825 TaxID=3448587 RepID=UPI004041B51F